MSRGSNQSRGSQQGRAVTCGTEANCWTSWTDENPLGDSNSSFMINVHPFSVYMRDIEIPIGYALFQEGAFSFRDDLATGVRYWNLYDVMIDAVVSALAVSGHENVPLIVTQTGWPCSPGPDSGEKNDANQVFAEMFLRGLVKHLRSGVGTPLSKEGTKEVYIFELFDKEKNVTSLGPVRQWGILYPNLTNKYEFDINGSSRKIVVWRNILMLLLVGLVPLLVCVMVSRVSSLMISALNENLPNVIN